MAIVPLECGSKVEQQKCIFVRQLVAIVITVTIRSLFRLKNGQQFEFFRRNHPAEYLNITSKLMDRMYLQFKMHGLVYSMVSRYMQVIHGIRQPQQKFQILKYILFLQTRPPTVLTPFLGFILFCIG